MLFLREVAYVLVVSNSIFVFIMKTYDPKQVYTTVFGIRAKTKKGFSRTVVPSPTIAPEHLSSALSKSQMYG